MRRAFADALIQVAAENPRVMFLTGDLGFQVFDTFIQRYGPRYLNVGVAEAQLVCAAAGLALEGWRPVVYSIASFMTGRAYEQIRISVNYPNLPVVVVGAGGGYTYAASGVTHHAADDLGLMSLLPNMTVVAPGDPNEITQLFPQLFQLPGPAYIRVGRFGEKSYTADAPAVLGQARLLREGERLAMVSTGDIAPVVIQAVTMLNAEGVYPSVYQMHTVKPLDTAALDRLAEQVETLIIVEEHLPPGGLWTAVSDWRVRRERGPALLRLGPPHALVLGNPERDELRQHLQYDAQSIADACRTVWHKTRGALTGMAVDAAQQF